MNISKENTGELTPNQQPLFRRANYILIGAGIVLLVLGYILLIWPKVVNPADFNPIPQNRLAVAVVLMLIGLIVEIVAVMYRPKK
jgi:hypothetical protein